MEIPDYWMTRPATRLDDETRQAFDALYAQLLAQPLGTPFAYPLAAPKWQFLCYLGDHHALAFHGSGNPAITTFEPRQANDLTAFGNQLAVYASSDPLWAMYFAIIDRDHYSMSLCNACISVQAVPYYFFSITQSALVQQPWRTGSLYLLPRTSFTQQPAMQLGDTEIHIAHLASLTPVTALARLEVAPQDFPFLDQIRGHNDDRLAEIAEALQTGRPLLDEP